ncbi:MAG: hypothetical protein C0582_04435 [Alphaproteobacteria bacterium]|nr:MAG: hypothetical protein C0582_04435 [Alphaproteobacteria bacterium]
MFKSFSAIFLLTLCFSFAHGGGEDDYVLINKSEAGGELTQQVVKGKRLQKKEESSWLPDLGVMKMCRRFSSLAALWSNPESCSNDSSKVAFIIGYGLKCNYPWSVRRPTFPCLRAYMEAGKSDAAKAVRMSCLKDSTQGNGGKMLDMALEWTLKAKEDPKKDQEKKLFITKKRLHQTLKEFRYYSAFVQAMNVLQEKMVKNPKLSKEKLLETTLNSSRFKEVDRSSINIIKKIILAYDRSRKGYFLDVPISHAAKFFRDIVIETDEGATLELVNPKIVADIYQEWWETYFTKLEYPDHPY